MKSQNKRLSRRQKYRMCLDSFYNLKSDLKFKGYELNLVKELNYTSVFFILKELNTGKEYKGHITDTICVNATDFIKVVKGWNLL